MCDLGNTRAASPDPHGEPGGVAEELEPALGRRLPKVAKAGLRGGSDVRIA